MLLVCKRPYLTSVLGYKFSNVDTIMQALHLRKQGHEVRGYFLKPKAVPEQNRLGKSGLLYVKHRISHK